MLSCCLSDDESAQERVPRIRVNQNMMMPPLRRPGDEKGPSMRICRSNSGPTFLFPLQDKRDKNDAAPHTHAHLLMGSCDHVYIYICRWHLFVDALATVHAANQTPTTGVFRRVFFRDKTATRDMAPCDQRCPPAPRFVGVVAEPSPMSNPTCIRRITNDRTHTPSHTPKSTGCHAPKTYRVMCAIGWFHSLCHEPARI
jgi:hypothetical protein